MLHGNLNRFDHFTTRKNDPVRDTKTLNQHQMIRASIPVRYNAPARLQAPRWPATPDQLGFSLILHHALIECSSYTETRHVAQ
jgi:hypothetical protein